MYETVLKISIQTLIVFSRCVKQCYQGVTTKRDKFHKVNNKFFSSQGVDKLHINYQKRKGEKMPKQKYLVRQMP